VSVHALNQVTDAANLFRLNLDQPVPGNSQNQLATGQPFTHREYGASWRYDNGRTSLDINAIDYSDHYQLTPNSNVTAKQANALVGRHLSASLNWDLGLTYEHDTYGFGSTSHTINAITSLRWRVGPRVGLRFLYAHSSQSPNGYQDNQIGVTASYALTTAAKAADSQLLQPIAPASQPYLH
jgi:hypothetical protein